MSFEFWVLSFEKPEKFADLWNLSFFFDLDPGFVLDFVLDPLQLSILFGHFYKCYKFSIGKKSHMEQKEKKRRLQSLFINKIEEILTFQGKQKNTKKFRTKI